MANGTFRSNGVIEETRSAIQTFSEQRFDDLLSELTDLRARINQEAEKYDQEHLKIRAQSLDKSVEAAIDKYLVALQSGQNKDKMDFAEFSLRIYDEMKRFPIGGGIDGNE